MVCMENFLISLTQTDTSGDGKTIGIGIIVLCFAYTLILQAMYFINVYSIDKKEYEMGLYQRIGLSHYKFLFFCYARKDRMFISLGTLMREIVGYLNLAFIMISLFFSLFIPDLPSIILFFTSLGTTCIMGIYSGIKSRKLK